MRVVFDTNIFISALAIPGGMAEKAVSRVIEGHDELVISPQIIKAVLSVLSTKFGRDREALSHVAVILSELGELVEPKQTVRVLKDDPDNRILECARF
jgi:putative PIN family toxin of toxin-antitoxin system